MKSKILVANPPVAWPLHYQPKLELLPAREGWQAYRRTNNAQIVLSDGQRPLFLLEVRKLTPRHWEQIYYHAIHHQNATPCRWIKTSHDQRIEYTPVNNPEALHDLRHQAKHKVQSVDAVMLQDQPYLNWDDMHETIVQHYVEQHLLPHLKIPGVWDQNEQRGWITAKALAMPWWSHEHVQGPATDHPESASSPM